MIHIRSAEEIALLREAGRIVAQAHERAKELLIPGVRGFKGFQGFPASVCFSLNNEVVHGIPGRRAVKEGDVVSIDIGVEKDGYYGDSAWSWIVGEDVQGAGELLAVTEESLYKGIAKAVDGNRLFDISHAVQTWVEGRGFSVVREMVGHGIGTRMHEEPQIPNFGPPGRGPLLKAGMVFAIEPMVNQGSHEIATLKDGWTAVTRDRSLSAHFEHCVSISDGVAEILTLP